jgi:hypothetical protein
MHLSKELLFPPPKSLQKYTSGKKRKKYSFYVVWKYTFGQKQFFPSESIPPDRSGVWFFGNLGLEKEALFVRALDIRC